MSVTALVSCMLRCRRKLESLKQLLRNPQVIIVVWLLLRSILFRFPLALCISFSLFLLFFSLLYISIDVINFHSYSSMRNLRFSFVAPDIDVYTWLAPYSFLYRTFPLNFSNLNKNVPVRNSESKYRRCCGLK